MSVTGRLPDWLHAVLKSSKVYTLKEWQADSGADGGSSDDGRVQVGNVHAAEAVSSARNAGNRHRVMLDIDVPVALVRSTQNHHLYFDVDLSWDDYRALLEALAKCGIIEPGYAKASIKRKATFLRLPWIRKGTERSDMVDHLEAWMTEPPELPF